MKIFVSVVSYRDPLLADTIRSVLDNASGRHSITVGVFEQTVSADSLETVDESIINDPRVRYKRIDPIYSEGVGWARAINAMQIENEDLLYQIDSHMVFDPDWDRYLVNDWKKARNKMGHDKVIITGSCLNYSMENGVIHKHVSMMPQTCKVKYFHYQDNGIIGAHGELIPATKDVEPAIHICAGNFCVPTKWVKEVGINHKVFFDGEEQLLVLSSVANGYMLFHPTSLHCYHFVGSGNYVTKQWHEPIISMDQYGNYVKRSIEQLTNYIDNIDEDVLEQYREWSGVDYINERLEQKAITNTINIPDHIVEPYDAKKRRKLASQKVIVCNNEPQVQTSKVLDDVVSQTDK